jgi:ABC-type transporter Mla subunit MlaD
MRRQRAARTDHLNPRTILIGAGIVTGLIVIAFAIAMRAPANGLPGQSFDHLTVRFAQVGNVRPRNEVRIFGRRVGQVLEVRLADGRPTVDLQLDTSVGRLPVDTTAVVRAKGLLGARYVELNPGRSASTLADGGTLDMRTAESITVDVPTALSAFDKRTRGAMGVMFDELGTGLVGRSSGLRDTFADGPAVASENQRLAEAILARTGAAARLAPSLDAGMTALDGARDEIAAGMKPAADAFRAIADARAGVEGTLVAAPPALASTTTGLRTSQRLLTGLGRLAVAVNGTLPPAPRALDEAARLLTGAQAPLRRADRLLEEVPGTVPEVLQLTTRLRPVLDPVERVLASLTPIVRTANGYGCDIDGFASNWRSMLGYGRPNNDGKPQDKFRSQLNTLRLEAIFGLDDLVAGTAPDRPAPNVRADAYPATCSYPTQHITG